MSVLGQIVQERIRQDCKWGQQDHDDGKWSLIFNEEYGEVARALLENDLAHAREELVQSAAVLVAWVQAIDRRGLIRRAVESPRPCYEKWTCGEHVHECALLEGHEAHGEDHEWACEDLIAVGVEWSAHKQDHP